MKGGNLEPVTAFILAGGKSLRMGSDKAFTQLNGCTLLQRALDAAGQITQNVTIVGLRAKFSAFGPVVEDVYPNRGPLAAIHAALQSSATDLNLLLAVDLPYVTSELLRYLITQAQATPALITLPRTSDGWQPLCAIYKKAFAQIADAALQQNQNAIHTLIESSTPRIIEEQELNRAGFTSKMFHNINTESDLPV